MTQKLPEMYVVALEVLDDAGLWQTASTKFAGEDVEPYTYSGEHVGRGGAKSLLTRTVEPPPSLSEVMEVLEYEKREWLNLMVRAGIKLEHAKERIRISKSRIRSNRKDINTEGDENG